MLTIPVISNPLTPSGFSSVVWTNGTLSLTWTGALGADYTIQASRNRVQWATVFPTNSPSLPATWQDADATAPARFYRLMVGPP